MPNNVHLPDVHGATCAYVQYVHNALDAWLPRCLVQLIFAYANLNAATLAGEIVASAVTGWYSSPPDEQANIRGFQLQVRKEGTTLVFELIRLSDDDGENSVCDVMPMSAVYSTLRRDYFRGFLHDMYAASVRWPRYDEYGLVSSQISAKVRKAYIARISMVANQLQAWMMLKR